MSVIDLGFLFAIIGMAFETPLYPPKTPLSPLTPLSNPTRTLCKTLCKTPVTRSTSESQGSPKISWGPPEILNVMASSTIVFLKERILGLEQHKSGNSGPGPDQCNFPR